MIGGLALLLLTFLFTFRSPDSQRIEDGAHGSLSFFLPFDSHFLAAFSVFTKKKGWRAGWWMDGTDGGGLVWAVWLSFKANFGPGWFVYE